MEERAGPSRTTATVLFTDVVGSTALRSRLGEEAAEALRRRHDRVLADAIRDNGGRVVKSLGDGIMAAFAGACDAVAAAVAVQQAVERLNRSATDDAVLALRVGVSAGDVSSDGDDLHGTAVIEASRLCGAAGGGGILISEVVRLLAGSAGGGELSPRGPLELKGLPSPVTAWDVRWPPAVSAIPMPALLSGASRIFVGREGEIQKLRQLWKETGTGERRVALIAGEPGVGKTRLVAELAAEVHADGAAVLAGRCDEDLGVPYQPFVEALRHFLDHASRQDARSRLGRYGGELSRLVPELADAVSGLPPPLGADPETERYRLFDAVAAWIAAVSTEEPLLLVLDDLHWAAKPTLMLMRHVLHSPELRRVLVVGTFRDSELDRAHPMVELLADLSRSGGLVRLTLLGLDSSAVAACLERAAGHPLDPRDRILAEAIHEETAGNPFFVWEVVRHLAETGSIERHAGRWAIRRPLRDLGIPETVRDVVGRRLSRLSEAANRALPVAAVVGSEFDAGVVQRAGGLDEEALLLCLDEATDARLIIEAGRGRYRFAHALVRDTLYGELSAARRLALHRRVAEAIEHCYVARLDDQVEALAHHWARATVPGHDPRRAVGYATRAGDRALAQLAHHQAAAYYGQALELLDLFAAVDDPQRLELLIRLGDAQRRAGDPAHRQSLLRAATLAQERGDGDALARAALANKRGMWGSAVGKVDAERVAVLDRAVEAVGSGDSATRARLLAALADEVVYLRDAGRRLALVDEAVAVARRVGDPATLAEVLLLRQSVILGPDTVRDRLEGSGEILALADRLANPVFAARALLLRIRAAREAADFAEAQRCLDMVETLSEELGQPTLVWLGKAFRISGLTFAGHIDEAEHLVGPFRELAEGSGQLDALGWVAWELFQIRLEQDRMAEMQDVFSDVADQNPNLPASRATLALCHCEAGQPEKARPIFTDFVAQGFSHPVDNMWLRSITDSAAVCTQLGDGDAAARLRQLLNPYASQVVALAAAVSGSVSHYLGLLTATMGDWDEAEGHFHAAEVIHARVGAPAWLARTRLEWARMLFGRRGPGDAERARELLASVGALLGGRQLKNVERRWSETQRHHC